MRKIRLILALVAALSLGGALSGTAAAQDKVTICHATSSATNPFVTLTISENAVYGRNGNAGHFEENGTPKAGHEEDYFGPCESAPTPTPTVVTTPTPAITPSPSPSDGDKGEVDIDVECPGASVVVTFTFTDFDDAEAVFAFDLLDSDGEVIDSWLNVSEADGAAGIEIGPLANGEYSIEFDNESPMDSSTQTVPFEVDCPAATPTPTPEVTPTPTPRPTPITSGSPPPTEVPPTPTPAPSDKVTPPPTDALAAPTSTGSGGTVALLIVAAASLAGLVATFAKPVRTKR